MSEVDEKRYSWVVRNSDDEAWTLLAYRFISREEALKTAGHWGRHFRYVLTVEVEGEQWTPIA